MSHFAVMVVGNIEEQLAPFDENLKIEFDDKTEEYQNQWETDTIYEFYCNSDSSWGLRITKEFFDELKDNIIGSELRYDVVNFDPLERINLRGKYKGYYTLDDGSRCEDSAWFEVISITSDISEYKKSCKEGEITVRVIEPPKELTMKEKFGDYKTYLKEYHGFKEGAAIGYWYNPDAKWDWYSVGGRYSGKLVNKAGEIGDSFLKKDLDFDKMKERRRELSIGWWEEAHSKDYDYGFRDMVYGISNGMTLEEYIEKHSKFSTFAVLKDGKWAERGKLGWWAVVTDEKENWEDIFQNILESVGDDELITIVDCHI